MYFLMETVSIITLTNKNRNINLELLLVNIIEQTYTNITELYLIEIDYENHNNIQELINKYQSKINFKIYYHNENNNNNNILEQDIINIVEQKTIGDIIFRMHDDTYYFSSYIEDAIISLKSSRCSLGYCSKPYVYDVLLEYLVKLENKTYSSSLIYYKNHKSITPSELDLECKFIKIVDNDNFYIYRNEYYKSIFEKITLNLDIIPNIYKSLTNYVSEYSSYDIVYSTGLFSITWDPRDNNLGGSEQAIIKLSEEWAKLGKSVCVYSNFKFNKLTLNNVDYYNNGFFPLHQKFKNLICWRLSGLYLLLRFNIHIDNLFIDLHDNFSYTLEKLNIDITYYLLHKSNYIMLKSNYHKKCFIEYLNKYNKSLDDSKLIVINNGLRIDEFNKNINNIVRQPYRFCYCSSYDRGLELILKLIWPHIYKQEPNSELHIYYGMDYINDVNFKTEMTLLMGQPGVMDHGRMSSHKIIEEKYNSTFHIYITLTDAEIDCISIRESLVTGCIPIIYNHGVFEERDGIKYDLPLIINNNISVENCEKIANDIVSKMKNFELINNMRTLLSSSNTISSWEESAKSWNKLFKI
jgi:hypothetical protein